MDGKTLSTTSRGSWRRLSPLDNSVASSRRGLLFYISEIRWLSESEVEVEGGYYEAGLSASGNTYHLSRNRGSWIVEEA